MLQNALPALFLLVVMVVVAVVLQRYRRNLPGLRSKQGPALTVMNGVSLGPQQRLVSVQVGSGENSTCLVLGVAPGGIQLLHQMPMADLGIPTADGGSATESGTAAEADASVTGAFARKLADLKGGKQDAS
ncbi:flagellar biosynthetic protein FliO [Hydrogenophaga sp. 5NK40-0174]|uniref:flagellar biosynthetic protein FliO n=1 Tax=Hydrogenophaga sp. 5NK40-0174 TaxID=3127649 RepID=UPI003101BBD5